MSTGLRKRSVCQVCGSRFQGIPLEVQMHGGNGWRGFWRWSCKQLCAVCKTAQVDFWFGSEERPPLANWIDADGTAE